VKIKIDESLTRLEEITKRLEEEALPLEEALELFAAGVQIAAAVKKELERAKTTIRQVVEESDGLFSLAEFDI
jgi:exodeoxyribonuclease VII small subunit